MDNVGYLWREITTQEPAIVFNQVEQFNGQAFQERNFVGFLEMMGIPYTGTNVSGIILSKNKDVAKKILAHHKINTPHFLVIPKTKQLNIDHTLRFPLIVKPRQEDASYGISQHSLVYDNISLEKRVRYIFNIMKDDALVEEYIIGREIYSGLLGNETITCFPPREMIFKNSISEDHKIATFQAKWNEDYRKKWGIQNIFPKLSPRLQEKIQDESLRAYRALSLEGYARLDLRLTPDEKIFFLEANPNPHLARDEDFALSAKKFGISYEDLIQKIIELGLEKNN
ncbi:MAG: hypothetical protein IPJ69_09375 [Deltaproteobacteria bacterium]|nr:MAG: hypothetical protein IPJ69_09375 [Deltaproteobacteria bacterium]